MLRSAGEGRQSRKQGIEMAGNPAQARLGSQSFGPARNPRHSEQRADEALQLEVELRDHVVGSRREAEAGPEVVFDSARQLPPQHREEVVLLLVAGIDVVHEADAAVAL